MAEGQPVDITLGVKNLSQRKRWRKCQRNHSRQSSQTEGLSPAADRGVGVKENSTWGNGQPGGLGFEGGGAGKFRWEYVE